MLDLNYSLQHWMLLLQWQSVGIKSFEIKNWPRLLFLNSQFCKTASKMSPGKTMHLRGERDCYSTWSDCHTTLFKELNSQWLARYQWTSCQVSVLDSMKPVCYISPSAPVSFGPSRATWEHCSVGNISASHQPYAEMECIVPPEL